MGSVNLVILLGRLGKDPEVRFSKSGLAVCTMSMATSQKTKGASGAWEDKVEWHRVTVFDKQAQTCVDHLRKGSLVHVQGRLETSRWKDKEGHDKQATCVIATQIQFAEPKGGGGGQSHGGGSGRSEPQDGGGGYGNPDDVPF